MTFLFVGSTGDHAGHTILIWALAQRLLEKGYHLGFLKPFGTHPRLLEGEWVDLDALLFKKVMNLQEPFEYLCPYPLAEKTPGPLSLDEIPERIKTLASELIMGREILIVMGSRHIFFDDASFGISDVFLNKELKAEFILIERFRSIPKSMYSILSIHSLLRNRIKGIILNRVNPEEIENIRNKLTLQLAKKDVNITTVLPEDPVLSLRSIGEIAESLNGEFLCGEKQREQPVIGTTLGSLELTGDLRIFKRVFNKIILLKSGSLYGGDQAEVSSRSVAGILLTGGRKPPLQIIETAKRINIPLLLIKDDTFMAMEKLEEMTAPLSLKDETKARYFMNLMDHDQALDRLIVSLGLEV